MELIAWEPLTFYYINKPLTIIWERYLCQNVNKLIQTSLLESQGRVSESAIWREVWRGWPGIMTWWYTPQDCVTVNTLVTTSSETGYWLSVSNISSRHQIGDITGPAVRSYHCVGISQEIVPPVSLDCFVMKVLRCWICWLRKWSEGDLRTFERDLTGFDLK